MKENPEYEVGNVIVRMSNLSLWKYRNPSVTPRHTFRLSVVTYGMETLFYQDLVVEGYSSDFEFRESAQAVVIKSLKEIDTDLIPQTKNDSDKFIRFVNAFNDKLQEFVSKGVGEPLF